MTPKPGSSRVREAWERRPLRLTVAAAAPVLAAVAFGLATPRGPLTATAGIGSLLAGLAAGWLAGFALRSRWAMLAAPVLFAAVFELVRLGTDGPTVDAIHLSPYGLIAFVTGRGVHALLVLLPMVLGAALGAGAARRPAQVAEHRRPGGWLIARRTVAALTGLALVGLAVLVARPASTDPITGPGGKPLAGSIAELTRVEIGGHDLALMLRGRSTGSPVALFLAGGPGGSELGAMRLHLEALERDVVMATFDQRGAGKSYAQLDPTETLTLDRAVADVIEVSEYLRERFDQDRIVLIGQSWGTILGVLAAQQRPDLYRALVGTGQMVSPRETDRAIYRDTLAWARANGKDDVVSALTRIGEPPYANILDYESALSYEHEVYPYDRTGNSEGEGGFSENLFVEEYTLLEQLHNLAAFLDTFSVLYPQLQRIDFREQATRLEVPVYLVQGAEEARGRAELAQEWFAQLRAPRKRLIMIDHAGHRPLFERPAEFRRAMAGTVLPQTAPDR
ncbi:MAG: alpha/beta hydrolase [Solirubrobacteraceae bacterium]|nr:alpha/beta hydrolase [Solirubrobacteraceae bacterium]